MKPKRPPADASSRAKGIVRSLRKATTLLRDRYLWRHQVRLATWLRHGRHHVAPIDPFQNISLDPSTVDRWIDFDRDDFMRVRFDFGVRGGDWDLVTEPIDQHFVFASIDARFNRGLDWDETPIAAVARAGIAAGDGRYHGCRTEEQLAARWEQLDALYQRVRNEGYRSQRELGNGDHPLRRRRNRPPEIDEVMVNIGRDGAIIFIDGIHRFSVARVVGVPSIPACVLTRHAAWQAYRDRVARAPADFPPSVFEHPDLATLRPAGAHGGTATGGRT